MARLLSSILLLIISLTSAGAQAEPWRENLGWRDPELLKNLETKFAVATHLNPFYLNGDFDGDCKLDVAVLVKQKGTGKVGIAVLRAASSKVEILGAGTPIGNGGDDFRWMDVWSVHYRGAVGKGAHEGPPPTLKGDALLVVKSESASGIIYWNGKTFQWYQQGD